jgi:hypothetical protein
LDGRSTEKLTNDINISFARHYVSPFILKQAINEATMLGDFPILHLIDWGLRARGVFDDVDYTSTAATANIPFRPSASLLAAYNIGVQDGRIQPMKCKVDGQFNMFLMKKFTLLFLCEYGDEIIYSRLVLQKPGMLLDKRTVWLFEAVCPDLMHSEIRIFANIRSKLIGSLVELQVGNVPGKKFLINNTTKQKIAALEAHQLKVKTSRFQEHSMGI